MYLLYKRVVFQAAAAKAYSVSFEKDSLEIQLELAIFGRTQLLQSSSYDFCVLKAIRRGGAIH